MFTSPRVFLCMMIGIPAFGLAGCERASQPVAPPQPPTGGAQTAAEVPDAPAAPDAGDNVAGGEAHVHGAGEFAVAVEGDLLTVTLDAPLANFGLGEGDTDALEVSPGIIDGLVTLEGAVNCQLGDRRVETRTSGYHSSLTLTLSFTCKTVEKLESVRLNAFTEFPDFETVNAVFVGPDAQVANVLTRRNPELSTR